VLAAGAHKITFAAGEFKTNVIFPSATALLTIASDPSNTISAAAAIAVIRGQIQSVSMSMSAQDKFSTKVTSFATAFSFTTQLSVPIGGKLIITLPASYFSAKSNPTGILYSSPLPTVSSCTMSSETKLTIVCNTTTASLAPGSHNITFAAGELTTADASDSNDKIQFSTSDNSDVIIDRLSVENPVETIVKGSVTNSSMTMSPQDQYASLPTLSASNFSFITQSDHPMGGAITITLPPGYLTGKSSPIGVLSPSQGSATLSGCTLSAEMLNLVCTSATAILPAGSHSISFAAGELVTGVVRSSVSNGLTIETSSNSVSDAVPSLKLDAAVILVSLNLDAADKIMNKVTGGIATFAFTTQAPLMNDGTITIILPPYYFTAKTSLAASLVPQSGSSTLAGPCSMTPAALSIVCQITNGVLPPGAHMILVAAGELTTGMVNAVVPCFSIKTSAEAGSRPTIPTSLSVFSQYPVISLSHVIKAFTNVKMYINLQPAILIPSDGKLTFTISGSGLSCAPNTTLTFTSPSSAAGTAMITGQVLTVSFTSGLFSAGSNISFFLGTVTNPSQTQNTLRSLPSAALDSTGVVLGICSIIFFPGLFSDLILLDNFD
jgi:hypothetical protein